MSQILVYKYASAGQNHGKYWTPGILFSHYLLLSGWSNGHPGGPAGPRYTTKSMREDVNIGWSNKSIVLRKNWCCKPFVSEIYIFRSMDSGPPSQNLRKSWTYPRSSQGWMIQLGNMLSVYHVTSGCLVLKKYICLGLELEEGVIFHSVNTVHKTSAMENISIPVYEEKRSQHQSWNIFLKGQYVHLHETS